MSEKWENKKFDRRSFFTFGFSKSKEKLAERIEKKIPRIGMRPPGAISEDEFLLKCTRCEECITACPHDVLFSVGMVDGRIQANTPFIDINYKACEMCEDFPCISACEPNALVLEPQFVNPGMAIFNEQHCLSAQGQYCDYCKNACPKAYNAITMGDNRMPIIDTDLCVGCGKCAYICPSQSGRALDIDFNYISPKPEDTQA